MGKKITEDDFEDFYETWLKHVPRVDLGKAFCNHFGIVDDHLMACKDRKTAERVIRADYIEG